MLHWSLTRDVDFYFHRRRILSPAISCTSINVNIYSTRQKKWELLIISVTKNENVFWLGFCTWRLTCILFLVAKENITLLALRCYGDGRHLEKMRIDKFLPMCCGLKTMNVAFGFILTQSNLVPLEREWLHLSNSCIFVWFRASYIM